jgi:hypothetical protein
LLGPLSAAAGAVAAGHRAGAGLGAAAAADRAALAARERDGALTAEDGVGEVDLQAIAQILAALGGGLAAARGRVAVRGARASAGRRALTAAGPRWVAGAAAAAVVAGAAATALVAVARRLGAAAAAEDLVEDVGGVLLDGGALGGHAVGVVARAQLGVAQDTPGLGGVLEDARGLLVVGALVGVVLARHRAVRPLDLLCRRAARHAQGAVEIVGHEPPS